MGYLLNKESQLKLPLREHHTVGRRVDKVDTVVADPVVSRIHAAIEWRDDHWQLKDLSSNGTWLDGKRLQGSGGYPLQPGSTMCFGREESTIFELVDAAPPTSMLLATSGEATDTLLHPYLFLPNDETPEFVVYYSQAGRCWHSYPLAGNTETHGPQDLAHGQLLNSNTGQWRVFLAETGLSTQLMSDAPQKLDDYQFMFDLSLDEEITRLTLMREQLEIDMGERSHHYLLMHLARHRTDEAAKGVDEKSQGWMDKELLARELGIDVPHLNILIFRARKQIAEKLVVAIDSEQLVERRKGQVRFGCPHFTIHKGATLTHEMRNARVESASPL
jgi:FHA domain